MSRVCQHCGAHILDPEAVPDTLTSTHGAAFPDFRYGSRRSINLPSEAALGALAALGSARTWAWPAVQ